MLCVGLIAGLLSAKLYERFRRHNTIARFARNLLDPTLAQIRKQAEHDHREKFPLLFRLGLHVGWNFLLASFPRLG